MVLENQEGWIRTKIKSSSAFLSDKKDWEISPIPCTFFSKSIDPNFETVMFVSIVEISNNYVFRGNKARKVFGKGL